MGSKLFLMIIVKELASNYGWNLLRSCYRFIVCTYMGIEVNTDFYALVP